MLRKLGPHKEEKHLRKEPMTKVTAPVPRAGSPLVFLGSWRFGSCDWWRKKMNRNNCLHEASGNQVQIQEKKNETGKGGSHF